MPARPKTAHLFVVEDRGYSTPCHVWTRALNSAGYGVRRVAGRMFLAHRYAYEQEIGPIPAGLVLDHLCCVPSCVNSAHLEAVTQAENCRRGEGTRLTFADVAAIRARAGERHVDIAADYGVHPSWIERIHSGRSANRAGPAAAWDVAA